MTESDSARKPRVSLSVKTLIGLILGIGSGLFFGEACGRLQVVGNAYIGLLQMAVLPYIVVSLVASIGSLSPGQAGRILGRASVIVLLLWGIAMGAVGLMAATFPPRQAAAFFSNQLLETPESIDFVTLFIPSNPFRSLSDNAIAAVVVFCVGSGIALMQIANKSLLIKQLDAWLEVFSRLNGYVVKLSPYGIFAIAASASGTMTPDKVNQLQAYLLSYTAAVVLIGLFVLPALVTACTPFRYRDILDVTLQAMLTAFATDKLLVVLPMLTEKTKELFESYRQNNDEVMSDIELIYPLTYPIPNMGKLLSLAFVPFAAWFAGTPLLSEDYPTLMTLGSVTYFGRPIVAMPFLLDTFHVPIDTFQLFLVTGVYCARIGDVLAVMNLFTITALATCWSQGMLVIRWPKMVTRLGLSLVLALGVVVGLRNALTWSAGEMSSPESVIEQMQNLRHPSAAIVHTTIPNPAPDTDKSVSGLARIQESRVLRIGFIKNRLPYSYFNSSDQLVGLDVDMAHMLAEELKCKLEFMPFQYPKLADHLNANDFDVAMTGIPITTDNLLQVGFSEPYMRASWALVVRDHRRSEFTSVENMRQIESLTIAIPPDAYYYGKTRGALPNAKLVEVSSPKAYFSAPEGSYDALLVDAESGSVWTFIYPGYSVIVPRPRVIKQPLAYAVRRTDKELAEFLTQWVGLKQDSGEFEELYQYWILGRKAEVQRRRWSVLDNVLRNQE